MYGNPRGAVCQWHRFICYLWPWLWGCRQFAPVISPSSPSSLSSSSSSTAAAAAAAVGRHGSVVEEPAPDPRLAIQIVPVHMVVIYAHPIVHRQGSNPFSRLGSRCHRYFWTRNYYLFFFCVLSMPAGRRWRRRPRATADWRSRRGGAGGALLLWCHSSSVSNYYT